MGYALSTTVAGTFDDTLQRTRAALADEGFGVLTEIDVHATLKAKLDVDTPPHVILGACRPPLAHAALQGEPSVGLLLPCNVVVRDDAAGKTHVEFMDPIAILQMVDRPEVAELAHEVRGRLERVLASL